MKIPYLKREGSFRPQMKVLIGGLRSSGSVRIPLTPAGGYKGNVQVEIGSRNEDEFEADLELTDTTRFPARIRAAATELRDQGLKGTFRISHDDGVLEIRRL